MKVIRAYPPMWRDLTKHFPIKGRPNILYSYGDTLFNPSGIRIDPWIMAHEETHGLRQKDYGLEDWWLDYMTSPEFRLDEELLAHRAEWRSYRRLWPEKQAEHYLHLVAGRLASDLYGEMISYTDALKAVEK